MGTLTFIICVVIAVVLAVTKLMLEHQYDTDKAHGVAGDPAEYTMRGMIKRMRRERRERRKSQGSSYVPNETMAISNAGSANLRIKAFEAQEKNQISDF